MLKHIIKKIKYTHTPLCRSQAGVDGQLGWPTIPVCLGLRISLPVGLSVLTAGQSWKNRDGWSAYEPLLIVRTTFYVAHRHTSFNGIELSFGQYNDMMKCYLGTISCSPREGESVGREASWKATVAVQVWGNMNLNWTLTLNTPCCTLVCECKRRPPFLSLPEIKMA